MDSPSLPPPQEHADSLQLPQAKGQSDQQPPSPKHTAEPTPFHQAKSQEQPDIPSSSSPSSSPPPQPLAEQNSEPADAGQPPQELLSSPSPNPLSTIRDWLTSEGVLMINSRATCNQTTRPSPSHKHLRGRYYSDPENYLLTTENEESSSSSSSSSKQVSKKRRRNSTHSAAESPLKPRYILARRRRPGDLQPMLSPWLPLSPELTLISRETPSQWFPRSRFLDMELDAQDLSPLPLIPSSSSPSESEHTTLLAIPLETADVLPLATAVETVVQVQLPHIEVPHHGLSPDHNTPSPPQSGIDTPAQQQQQQEQQQEQHQQPWPPLHFLNFLQQRRRGHFVMETSLVVIRICEPSIATKLYSKFATLSNEQGLESVKSLDITLDWSWTQQDLEDLANAVRSCRFSTLTINGGSSRTPLRRRATSNGAASATLFNPLIQLFDLKCLTKIYLSNMPDCLQEFSVDFPADMSHIQELQIDLDIYNWANAHGQTANRLIKRLSHLERLIVDCPLEKYRAYLMNIWYALRAPLTVPANTDLTVTPPPKIIQVQLISRGKMHAEVSFRRPGAAPECLPVDLHNVKDYEVLWHPLLNSSMDQIIHTFRLANAPFNDWITLVLDWLKDREQQVPFSLSSSTVSTLNTTNTASTSTSTNNATNTSIRLREISLCCSPVRADSEKGLLDIIKTATSPTLGLQCLRLIGLHLPLNAPGGRGNRGHTRWSKFFVAAEFWNLEELEIRDSNFDDDQVEWLLLFIMSIKRMKEADEARWRGRQTEQEERKRQLELGLVTLEDGEVDENDGHDAGIVRMKLRTIKILGHSLSPEVQSNLEDRLRAMEPPIEMYL